MSSLNKDTYNRKEVVEWYEALHEIVPIEKHVFETYKEYLKGKVLDIGIGAGRTTNYLANKCGNYTGIDYSMVFSKTVKIRYPNADIRCMDARDLSDFENNTFDLINFSFNGIDYVDQEGRVKVLTEVNRVLKPGGVFFFSTHNMNHSSFNKPAWRNKENRFWINFKTFVKLLPFIPGHLNKKNHEQFQKDYAIINDSAHNYGLFTFYTSPAFLRTQLKEHNFSECLFFTKAAKNANDEELDDWIFVTCKKLLS